MELRLSLRGLLVAERHTGRPLVATGRGAAHPPHGERCPHSRSPRSACRRHLLTSMNMPGYEVVLALLCIESRVSSGFGRLSPRFISRFFSCPQTACLTKVSLLRPGLDPCAGGGGHLADSSGGWNNGPRNRRRVVPSAAHGPAARLQRWRKSRSGWSSACPMLFVAWSNTHSTFLFGFFHARTLDRQ